MQDGMRKLVRDMRKLDSLLLEAARLRNSLSEMLECVEMEYDIYVKPYVIEYKEDDKPDDEPDVSIASEIADAIKKDLGE